MLNPYESPRILSNDWPSDQTAARIGRLAISDGARTAKSAKLAPDDVPLAAPDIYAQIDSCGPLRPEVRRFETVEGFAEGQARWIAYSERIGKLHSVPAPALPNRRGTLEALSETVAGIFNFLFRQRPSQST